MDGFRSICFVHQKDDAYETYYLKEYFKWIGFSYYDFLYRKDNIVSQHPEKAKFDIIVNINSVMPACEKDTIESTPDSKLVELSFKKSDTAFPILRMLLKKIIAIQRYDDNQSKRLFDLADIYEDNNLAGEIGEYTSVLLEKMKENSYERACACFSEVLDKLDLILKKSDGDFQGGKNTFVEYILYAKYNCQHHLNMLFQAQKKKLLYDVEEFLNGINEIYAFDEDFFKVEYLKAKVAQQDCLYNAYSTSFMTNCKERCPVEICRSYHYYAIAKWRENNNQPLEASKAYRLSYSNNPMNIKAIFKIAVEKMEMGDSELAIEFFEKIIDICDYQDEIGLMPPKEIEYAYKTRMLLSDLKDSQLKGGLVDSANKYLQFIRDLKDSQNVQPEYFMARLYRTPERLEEICTAMLDRLDQRCMNQF